MEAARREEAGRYIVNEINVRSVKKLPAREVAGLCYFLSIMQAMSVVKTHK